MNNRRRRPAASVARLVLLVLTSFWMGARWQTFSEPGDFVHLGLMIRAMGATPASVDILEAVKVLADCASIASLAINIIAWVRSRWSQDRG